MSIQNHNIKIAIVVSKFHKAITNLLLEGALSRLNKNGIDAESIHVASVPGAIEIPLLAKLLAKSKKFNAIIALGAVIRGETSHYDCVCNQVSGGCQSVMMEFEIPVIFGVLTVENEMQAYNRVGGSKGHKGEEAADAAIAMIKEIASIY
jgi:6,7-dimethyl-8-ribityllumazine synthase